MLLRLINTNSLRCFTTIRSVVPKALTNHDVSIRLMSEVKEQDGVNKTPIPYFGSEASKWKAEYNRRGPETDVLWYQAPVILFSTSVFLIYFCILREENDIDLKLSQSLFVSVPELEKTQLLLVYKYNKDNGLDVKDIEARLKEIEAEEIKKALSVQKTENKAT